MRGGLLVLAAALALAGESGAAAPKDEGRAWRSVGTGSCARPAWAPDGSRLLFHARRKDDKQKGFATRNVWSVGADGAGERKLTGGTKDEYHASLSPDGKKLLFVSELNGSRDIWLADADGQNPVPLTDDPGTEDQPAWSSDGHQIAYAAFPKEGGSFDIWLVNADGSGRRRLTTTPANELFPAWHSSCAAGPTSTPRSSAAPTPCAARSRRRPSGCGPPTARSSCRARRWRASSSAAASAGSPASCSPTATP